MIPVQQQQQQQQSYTPSSQAAPEQSSYNPPTGGDAITQLHQQQQELISQIQAAIPDLTPKPDLSVQSPFQLNGYDAPGSSNVAWMADTHIPGSLSSLTIFNGPLTYVPHVLSRVVQTDPDTLHVALDLRPRSYGAYELDDISPETLGRKAFEYSGNRNEYETHFAVDILDASVFAGATPLPQSELDSLTGGPRGLYLSVPNTRENVAALLRVRHELVASWLRFRDGQHEHRPGAPINAQYVYDSKFRQNAYAALAQSYAGLPDGTSLAMAESGPLDEAYVGGAS